MEPKNERLLVVDNDASNLDTLARRLERYGFAVDRASSGGEALRHLDKTQVDLVLLNHHMPEPTGMEVLRRLRATHTSSELPVIMVTALNDTGTVVEALNIGANDYVTKPLDFEVALARIRAQLSRRAAEHELHHRDQRDAMAARGSNDGLWDWNLESNEIYYSRRWKGMLGCSDDEIDNSPAEWFSRIHPDDSNRVQHDLEAAISGSSDSFENEHRLQHKDLSWRWVLSRGKAIRTESGEPLRLAGSQTDVTESKIADPLTNLPNRNLFAERVANALAKSGREARYEFAVLLLDLDRFKVINDSLGRLIGDELLVGIARRLRGIDQKFAAMPARLSGDEFAILMDDVVGLYHVKKAAAWVQQSLAAPFSLEGRDVFCSVSIGIVLGPGDARTVEDILRDAETAMHRAKTLGGGRFEIFDNEMRKQAVARLELETDLRTSLAKGDFEVYYQPKVDLDNGHILGFEALVRWNHPRRGLTLPGEFIAVAEETGLIVPLGRFVLEQACHQLGAWQKEFPRVPPISMSVNVSFRQFRDTHLCENVERVLLEAGVDAGSLRIELTESVLMEDSAGAAQVLDRLKGIGVGLKIDDFGTGYSSLSYLCRLPFDTLKVDRSFVQDMAEGRDGLEIVKTVLALAAGLRLTVVAEGVETKEQAEQLRRLGCHYAQGFYFSRPVEAEAARRLLAGDPLPIEEAVH